MDVSEVQSRTLALAQARGEAEQVALAKTHFLATMSHEIRTPMSTLLGMLERLADSDLDARQQQVLATPAPAACAIAAAADRSGGDAAGSAAAADACCGQPGPASADRTRSGVAGRAAC
ncbi:hypothetical protein G6F60_015008 [Rhizopus arrhizus]|nr:hypothetical protein G6F60_015008 [Rhizopus arrhizus]